MKLSLVLTINNRTPEVSKAVADSFRLPGNEPDEIIVVLDRPTPEAESGARLSYVAAELPFSATVSFVELSGEPGWKGPARAWNAGFKAATGDLLYCISSEVVQDPGNVHKARELAKDGKTVVFGSCHNSEPTNTVLGFPPGLLVDAAHPRPLGFIACFPRKNVEQIRGFDEAFMNGFWYDDDDFYFRLWSSGLNFLFTDSIHGTHFHHDRPVLDTPQGQAGIRTNAQLMRTKWGTLNPWQYEYKIALSQPGRTEWRHP